MSLELVTNSIKRRNESKNKRPFSVIIFLDAYKRNFFYWDVDGAPPKNIDEILSSVITGIDSPLVQVFWNKTTQVGSSIMHDTLFPGYGPGFPIKIDGAAACFYKNTNTKYGTSITMSIDRIVGTERTILQLLEYKLICDIIKNKPKGLYQNHSLTVNFPLCDSTYLNLKYDEKNNSWDKLTVTGEGINGPVEMLPKDLLDSDFMGRKWTCQIVCSLKNIIVGTGATTTIKLKNYVSSVHISNREILKLR